MRKLLLLLSMIIIFSCSKNEDVAPLDEKKEEPLYSHIEKAILDATSDTVGLKLFGMGRSCINGDTMMCFLGCKNGKLWCGFFDDLSDTITCKYEEKYTWVSKEDLKTEFEYDAGYGEIKTITIPVNDGLNMPIQCDGWSKDEFAITIWGNQRRAAIVLIVNKGEICYIPNTFIKRNWVKGYYIAYEGIIYNTEGKFEYQMPEKLWSDYNTNIDQYFPVSIYNVINVGFPSGLSITINNINVKDDEIIWENEIEIGKQINGIDPKITYIQKIDDTYITLDIKAVNYDGTKDNKRVKLSLEDGREVV